MWWYACVCVESWCAWVWSRALCEINNNGTHPFYTPSPTLSNRFYEVYEGSRASFPSSSRSYVCWSNCARPSSSLVLGSLINPDSAIAAAAAAAASAPPEVDWAPLAPL